MDQVRWWARVIITALRFSGRSSATSRELREAVKDLTWRPTNGEWQHALILLKDEGLVTLAGSALYGDCAVSLKS